MAAGAPQGNKNATKDKRLITEALRRAVVQGPEKLKKACEKLLDNASEGDLGAFREIADRLDGKPSQGVTVGGDSENPIVTEIRRIIVNTTDQDS